MAKRNNEIIGTISTNQSDEDVYIYGFVVFPEYRGMGFGREILNRTVYQILNQGIREIVLEVETTNQNALGLYKSCGFKIAAGYDYYDLPVK